MSTIRYLIVRPKSVEFADENLTIGRATNPPALVMDLAAAWRNFCSLCGPKKSFAITDVAAAAGVSTVAIKQWEADGIVRRKGQAKHQPGRPIFYDRLGAFRAGVCGSLRRHGLNRKQLKAVAATLAKWKPEPESVPA